MTILLPSGKEVDFHVSDSLEFDIRSLLNEDEKERWCRALESGQYAQTQGFLHFQGSYCCLGVKCLVDNCDLDEAGMGFVYNECLYTETLPKSLSPALNESGAFSGYNLEYDGQLYEDLAGMNDAGFSFQDIACLIRRFF